MENLNKISAVDLKTSSKEIPYDDSALVTLFRELEHASKQKEKEFKHCLSHGQEDDYLSVTLSRLAYCFTKERYNTVFSELEKRGLNTF